MTPIPWRVGAIESGMVAVYGANGEEVTGFVSPEDGALITAAPDLFEAAQLCRQWMYEHASNTDDNAFEKLCAAIAKAAGE